VRAAVITPVAGRHGHLSMQRRGLQRSTTAVQSHVVVGMGDRDAADLATAQWGPPVTAVHIDVPDGRLPLSAARNAGAETAMASGADLLIFLDVDCIPAPRMVARYVECAREDPAPRLLCGPVAYLPPPPPVGYDLNTLGEVAGPHPARPHPAQDQTLRDGDPRLFWSLSFAVRRDVWARIGGFCEQYRGYGGEDTDFGQCAAAAGVRLDWTGGAEAYHQFHPTSDPPVQHLDDILANAQIFFRRWGWWPMEGWLGAFQRLGLAHFDDDHGWRSGQPAARRAAAFTSRW
jgi:GT2 family glycosyltransferase